MSDEKYDPNSMNAVLSSIDTKLGALSKTLETHEKNSSEWRVAHEKSDHEQFAAIRTQLEELKGYAYKAIGAVAVIAAIYKFTV